MYATIFASVVHIYLAPYLAITLNWKMKGIAIATCVHFSCRFLVSYITSLLDSDLKKALVSLSDPDCWDKEGLWDMFKLGWNSFLLKVMGWWAFDVFTQLAAFLATDDVAAQTILRNIGLFTYMIPVGISASMNFFTGKYIGAGDIRNAKKLSALCNTISFIWSFLSMAVVWSFKDSIMRFYTHDPDVTRVMNQAWYVLTIFCFFDCMQGVSAG
jgi:multidrug resistance protein, MATE family